MRVPGFTAEAALRSTAKTYTSHAPQHGTSQVLRPAVLDQDCYHECYDKNFENCVKNCPDIPPQ